MTDYLLKVTYQDPLDPTKLDHSFGLGGLLGGGLLGRRHLVTVGEPIFKRLLESKATVVFTVQRLLLLPQNTQCEAVTTATSLFTQHG